ncbi:leucyl aminopeptidase [Neorhodopirellula pilleata]|uniref:Probable cytosol aminopeptidase n=1 Tax=Neorhodopirellula pilleata TaxID=2714738 RepID=A0A5C6ARD6_9BACT|nr:leucyl aminopeptidase [Neorhodopirellula pilleata]TWU01626.1 Cytosol aminopeptidase [Neorhodopirellula pilleata]
MITPAPLPAPKITTPEQVTATGVMVCFAVQADKSSEKKYVSIDRIDELETSAKTALAQLIQSGEIEGKSGEIVQVATGHPSAPILVVAGLGKTAQRTRGKILETGAAVIRRLVDKSRAEITFLVGDAISPEHHDALVAGTLTGCEGQHLYQSEPAFFVPEKLAFVGVSPQATAEGETLGSSINLTRRLVNEPPTIMNPTEFAERAKIMASEEGLECEIWDETRLEKEGCRAILAVGRASTSPPRLVILKYNGGGDEAPIAIVGKGVTFDSGGLSIKPSDGMVDMKCDMAGAATVVGAMRAIAQLGLKRNVIGLCGLAENMISGDAYKLGDVIETRSGKTIEILNTDAEGRVVLADTLDVAVQHKPSAIIDLATLTGACMVALGNEVAGLMTNSDDLCRTFSDAAGQENEPVWQLPMFSLYDEKVKSKVADIKNVGEGRWGGAITAAKFLENFVGETPWVHIDIAGPAFADSPKPHRDAGATGVMVRSLVRWVRDRS